MARVPQIGKKEDLPPAQRQIFDEIATSRGRVSGPFSVLLNSPEMARRIAHAGVHIRFESSLSQQVKELAVLATAREADCQYAWTVHEPSAKSAGVRQEAIRSEQRIAAWLRRVNSRVARDWSSRLRQQSVPYF